ncbi:MAG: ABC transporter ATP-binding protein [Elusimicrobiales bacterium]|nr:ABC transporter ATP-binding protein [Elusimicrobiales bacterium]
MQTAAAGIKLESVTKTLGKTRALDAVSLDFKGGLLHGIIGPNGAGKTTLLRILAGLLHPDSGAVRFSRGGAQIPFGDIRPEIAYFPQEPSLYPDLSCAEHLEFFRDLYQLPRAEFAQKSEALLHLARLEKFRNRRAGQLSGGMYKKLGLICVLLHAPEILLLDEPTIGVDPVSRRELWDLMHDFSAGRMTIIMSTSYMDEAERCARVQLLENGKLLAGGEPGALLEKLGAASFEKVFLREGK